MFYQYARTKILQCKKIYLLSCLSLFLFQPVFAAGGPSSSIFSNTLAVTLIVLMLLLLIVIAILANLLVGTAEFKAKERKKASTVPMTSTLVLFFAFSLNVSAQESNGAVTDQAVQTIGGLSVSTFYLMSTVIFLELLVILALLVNVKLMVKSANQRLATELNPAAEAVQKISWWSRVNKFRPVAQEADIDLGHDYDGIRELDNRLPPWWLYGFYLSIVFAAIYLWRFHVSHTAPSSEEEYERSVQVAEAKIKEYLVKKGESVNENTVTVLAGADDISAGKAIFASACGACHKETGGGDVGPNLTDDYWMHGGDIKSIFKVVKYGYNAMPQWQNAYSNKQLAQVASYVKSLRGTNPPNAKAAQGELIQEEATPDKPVDSSAMKSNKVVMN